MDMLNVFLMVYVGGAILVTAAFAIIAMTAFILSKEDKDTEDDEGYKDAEVQNAVFLATALVVCAAVTWPVIALGLILDAITTE